MRRPGLTAELVALQDDVVDLRIRLVLLRERGAPSQEVEGCSAELARTEARIEASRR